MTDICDGFYELMLIRTETYNFIVVIAWYPRTRKSVNAIWAEKGNIGNIVTGFFLVLCTRSSYIIVLYDVIYIMYAQLIRAV